MKAVLCISCLVLFAGCGSPRRDAPRKPLACEGADCELYEVKQYERQPDQQGEKVRLVLETPKTRLILRCEQDASIPPPQVCGQGTVLAGEKVWGRRGLSGETLYVYASESRSGKSGLSVWLIESSEQK